MPGYGYGILNPFFGFGLTPLGIHSYFGYIAISPSRTCLVAASSRPLGVPFFGLGLTPLGIHSYFTESNLLGRGQLEASRRARARELQGYRGR